MNVFDVPWLAEAENGAYSYAARHHIVRRYRKALAEALCFLFNELLIPLLRLNFYVTEKHSEGRKIFYFRKPLWKLLEKLTLLKLEQANLRALSAHEF
jgi:hypothetical protein